MNSPQSQTPQSQTPQSQTPQSQTPQSQTPQSQTPQSQTPQSDKPQSDKPKSDKPKIENHYIYSVFHSIMALVAIYLSFKCNKGFAFGPFLVACCCPYIYIVYKLATVGLCSSTLESTLE